MNQKLVLNQFRDTPVVKLDTFFDQVIRDVETLKVMSPKDISNKSQILMILQRTRIILIHLDESQRLGFAKHLFISEFLEEVTQYLATAFWGNSQIIEELTWIWMILFSVDDSVFISDLVKDLGLLCYFDSLLTYDNQEVFTNVVWALGNLLISNPEYKYVFLQMDLLQKVVVGLQKFDDLPSVYPSLYQSYFIFLSAYFSSHVIQESQKTVLWLIRYTLDVMHKVDSKYLDTFRADLMKALLNLIKSLEGDQVPKVLSDKNMESYLKSTLSKIESVFLDNQYEDVSIICLISLYGDDQFFKLFFNDSILLKLSRVLKNSTVLEPILYLLSNLFLDEEVLKKMLIINQFEFIWVLFDRFNESLEKGDLSNTQGFLRVVHQMMCKIEDEDVDGFLLQNYSNKCFS